MGGHSSNVSSSSCSLLLLRNVLALLGIVILWLTTFVANAAAQQSSSRQQQEGDRIVKLPGQPPNVTFSHYSGYVTVDSTAGRALFYWFIQSPASKKPESKPLVLWLQGGPGLSSVAIGAYEEIGPFRVGPDGKTLSISPFAWNQEANLLFLDSPAGVGFSYSNTSSDLITGDIRTAKDTFIFLKRWLERFPQYKNRPFYIAGESYAGHYIPQVAKLIVIHNNGIKNPILNFKGFLLGNPLIDDYYDNIGAFEFWWNHGLISDSTYEALNASCPYHSYLFPSTRCHQALQLAFSEFGDINPFAIYNDPCNNLGNNANNSKMPLPSKFRGNDPCFTINTIKYMNIPEVQKALHANVARIAHPWFIGSEAIRGAWTDSPKSMLPIFKELMAAGLRIWVYSGDADAILPVTATRTSLKVLKLKNVTHWYAWVDNKKIGGWSQVYDGLTYVTVRGAGHEVPLFRPRLALALFRHFLKNEQLPSS